jgi:hypothetical protein
MIGIISHKQKKPKDPALLPKRFSFIKPWANWGHSDAVMSKSLLTLRKI